MVADARGSKPNIIVFMSDDVGWGDLGCYGGGENRGAPTPRLDRLAAEGLQFLSFYGQPSCTPGRAAAMTGRLPIRSGMTTVSFPGQGGGLPAAEWTLASVLKQAGYRTCQIGKWHLGEADYSMPTAHGFDEMSNTTLYHLNAYTYTDPTFNPDFPFDDAETMKMWGNVIGAVEGKAGEPWREAEKLDVGQDPLHRREVRAAGGDLPRRPRRRTTSRSSSTSTRPRCTSPTCRTPTSSGSRWRRASTPTPSSSWITTSASSSTRSASSASSRTRSSSGRRTTARGRTSTPTAATPRSRAPRAPTTKAAAACPPSPGGRARSRPAAATPRSSARSTSWRRSPTSPGSTCRAKTATASRPRSTAATRPPCSRAPGRRRATTGST